MGFFSRHVKRNEIHYSSQVYSPLISVYAFKGCLHFPISLAFSYILGGHLESVYIAGRRVYWPRIAYLVLLHMSAKKIQLFTTNLKKLARGEYVFNGADFPWGDNLRRVIYKTRTNDKGDPHLCKVFPISIRMIWVNVPRALITTIGSFSPIPQSGRSLSIFVFWKSCLRRYRENFFAIWYFSKI